MPPQVSVLIGPARSGKTFQLLGSYRQVLQASSRSVGVRALWLAPTSRSASLVRQALLAGSGGAWLTPGVMTFEQLVGRVLAGSPRRRRLVTPFQQRALLGQILRAALENKQLEFLSQVAARPGFVDLLLEHIRELERRGIRPTEFCRAQARGDPALQAELDRLYAQYEEALGSHGLCDVEGRHWAARDALAAGQCPWLRHVELVVADGFADFTRAQHEALGLLAERSERLAISLPGDADAPVGREEAEDRQAGRDDLFAKSRATLAELRRWHPRLEVQRLPHRNSAWPLLDHLSEHLFRHPRLAPPLPPAAQESLDRLALVGAAGGHDEIVRLAREIKRRLTAGEARPGDIVVVFRSLGDVASRVREVFNEFGIPHFVETEVPLLASGVVRTLLSLLRLDIEDWPFRRVVSVITNNTRTTVSDEARAATDWLVRDLQIARGRQALLDRVEQLAANAAEVPAGHPARKRFLAAVAAQPVLSHLAAALEELPQQATPAEWSQALTRLGTQLGLALLADATEELDTDETSDGANRTPFVDDRVAWQCVVRHLASLEQLAAWQDQPAPTFSRRDMLSALIDMAKHESLPQPHDEVGRVRVLSAATARTVSAKHLFLAGMSEQAFPSPERVGRFYSDEDYHFFAKAVDQAAAVSLPAIVQRPQEEMLLFYEVLSRATERLSLSYPALDDKAQTLPPSPYVLEVLRTVGEEHLAGDMRPVPSPLPVGPVPLGPAEWRVQAVANAFEKKHDLLAGLLRHEESSPVARSLEAALRVGRARGQGTDFGPFEGLFTSPAARERLAQRFGPQHLWSPTQFEEYAACPYQFYLKHVLGLEPLGELTLGTNFARRGTFLHDVLAEFHRARGEIGSEATPPAELDKPTFLNSFVAAVDKVRRSMPRSGVEAALVDIDRRQIEQWAESYYEELAKYNRQWSELAAGLVPSHFEVRFGPPRPGEEDTDDPTSSELPLELDISGERIKITGRIDRIDVGQAGDRMVFNVIDYKSGKRQTLTRDKVESGERLQPALYVMAAQAVLFDKENAVPLWAGYWSMKNGVSTDVRYSLFCSVDGREPSEVWKDLQSALSRQIGQFVRGIRHGDFPVVSRDDRCTSRCAFSTVCRIAQVRSLDKTWVATSDT